MPASRPASRIARRAGPWALLLGCALVVVWIRTLPAGLPFADRLAHGSLDITLVLDDAAEEEYRRRPERFAERFREDHSYDAANGREFTYLGGRDSYLWLRHARNYLRHGMTCDALIEGQCTDTLANAPVGAPMVYRRSLHIVAIVLVHRLIALFDPLYPLPASAYWVPVIVGALGVIPAFFIARRWAGLPAAVVAALTASLTPASYLQRSISADNDVWNVVLPLYIGWAAIGAIESRTLPRAALLASLAAAVTTLQATWSGWQFIFSVTLLGLLLALLLRCATHVVHRRNRQLHRAAGLRVSACALGVYYFATWALTTAFDVGEGFASIPRRALDFFLARAVAQAPAGAADNLHWPDLSATVAELGPPSFASIMESFYGPLPMAMALAGVVLAFLPGAGWGRAHRVVLAAALLACALVVSSAELGFAAVLAALLIPSAAALCLAARDGSPDGKDAHASALLLLTWFLGGLLSSYWAARFEILLGPPFAIAVGLAAARALAYLDWSSASLARLWRRVSRGVGLTLVGLLVTRTVIAGYATAVLYRPAMNDAWWDTLERLRDESPAEAIVMGWWHYGHWIKYVAERRVIHDGANLYTHVPHWFAKALLAPSEARTLGLLRMLACGSDAPPGRGAGVGLYGKLLELGLPASEAYRMVTELSALDRAAALRYLSARGIAEEHHERILESSHCDPPPAYLILSSEELQRRTLWIEVGGRDVSSGADPSWHLSRRWHDCDRSAPGRLVCGVGSRNEYAGLAVDRLVHVIGDPSQSRIHLHDASRRPAVMAPHSVLSVAGGELREWPVAPPERLSILVDESRGRALVGTPEMLRSTFVRAMYLQARPDARLEKLDERRSTTGERVLTWRIRW